MDVRVIAATHQDLPQLIQERKFREDLYYRLNVLPIQAPPLRERREDIPLLVHHFLDIVCQERSGRADCISEEAMERLVIYDWPGNVRELENTVERMSVLCSEAEIRLEDLPEAMNPSEPPRTSVPRLPEEGLSLGHAVDELERELILQALERTNWNKNQAARLLDMNRTTLLEKIKKRGLTQPE